MSSINSLSASPVLLKSSSNNTYLTELSCELNEIMDVKVLVTWKAYGAVWVGEDEDEDVDEELRTLFDFPQRYKDTTGLDFRVNR